MEYLVHLLFLLKLIAFLFDSFKIVIFIFCWFPSIVYLIFYFLSDPDLFRRTFYLFLFLYLLGEHFKITKWFWLCYWLIELWLESGVCSESPFINSSRFSLYLKENWFFWKEVHIVYQFYFSRASKSEGVPGGASGKNLPASWGDVRDVGSIPGLGRPSLKGGHGNPFQNSCLENPMERGVWRAMVHRAEQSQTRPND